MEGGDRLLTCCGSKFKLHGGGHGEYHLNNSRGCSTLGSASQAAYELFLCTNDVFFYIYPNESNVSNFICMINCRIFFPFELNCEEAARPREAMSGHRPRQQRQWHPLSPPP